MKNNQIESWALRIIEKVEASQPVEDSKVELKAEWPADHAKAARRIAGHANAARGEWILWLIGVDEQQGVKGAEAEEPNIWLGQIGKQFEGLVPRYFDLNVLTKNGQTVVAIVFETNRAPYVVKNPSFGKQAGEGVALEVPWREGTKVRTATRADLLLLLNEANLLLALLGELEWNLAVSQANQFKQSQFRTKKFFQAQDKGGLQGLPEELKTLLLDTYVAISNAQSHKLTLETCHNPYERTYPESTEVMARIAAKEKIETVLAEMREFLAAL